VTPEWVAHEHWRLQFGDRWLRFVDPRRFGMLDVVPARQRHTHKLLAQLGPEPSRRSSRQSTSIGAPVGGAGR